MIVYRAIGTRSEKLCYRNGTRNGMRNGMRNLFLIFEDQLKLCWFIVNYISLLICASLMHTFLILFMILLLKIFYLYKLLPLSYLIDVVLQNDPKFEMVSLNLFLFILVEPKNRDLADVWRKKSQEYLPKKQTRW